MTELHPVDTITVPAAWDNMLARIAHALTRPVVLAGGALRDRYLGKANEVKDLDIFAEYRGPEDRAILLEAFKDWRKVQDIPEEYTVGMKEVATVLAFEPIEPAHPSEPIVNIVLLAPAHPCAKPGWAWGPAEIVSRFDFGICQICYTRHYGVEATPAFFTDALNKTFTLIAPNGDRERNYRRFRRFQKTKYAGWKLVDPLTVD